MIANGNIGNSMKTCRIVALHGRGGNSIIFRQKLQPLINLVVPRSSTHRIEWIFPNAPHAHQSIKEPNEKFYEWWSLPPGYRSYNSSVYYGVNESIALVENLNPDILIGHSQGAMLSSILMSRSILMESSTSHMFQPKLGILSCAAYPLPFINILNKIKNIKSRSTSPVQSFNQPKLLHVISPQDRTNPYPSGLELAGVFDDCTRSNTIKTHDLGHKFSTDSALLQLYKQLIESVVSEL